MKCPNCDKQWKMEDGSFWLYGPDGKVGPMMEQNFAGTVGTVNVDCKSTFSLCTCGQILVLSLLDDSYAWRYSHPRVGNIDWDADENRYGWSH